MRDKLPETDAVEEVKMRTDFFYMRDEGYERKYVLKEDNVRRT